MPKLQKFDWKKWKDGLFPPLEDHSRAKLQFLRDYVEDYIRIRGSKQAYQRDKFKITLVDGFAGGSLYAGNELGSPFALLNAVKTATAYLDTADRVKPLEIEADFFFVEADREAFDCLGYQLQKSEYAKQVGKSIHLRKGKFDQHAGEIIRHCQKKFPKQGYQVIFFLDQCGYTDVKPQLVRQIYDSLNQNTEFIINVAVEHILDFMGDTSGFKRRFPSLGLESVVSADDLIATKDMAGGSWKFAVESKLGKAWKEVTGAHYFSPFYIQPSDNHRGYWLLHLAPHFRARSAVMDVQWRHGTGFRHYSHAGLNMLTFKADANKSLYLEGMALDDTARETARISLAQDFAKIFRDSHTDGITVASVCEKYTNETIANTELIKAALVAAQQANQLRIRGPSGAPKRGDSLSLKDMILPEKQTFLNLSKPI